MLMIEWLPTTDYNKKINNLFKLTKTINRIKYF